MATITCPECSQVSEFEALRRSADEFCSHCDYPLFWARPDGPALLDNGTVDDSRRRLPGTGGRMTVGSRACPECAEQNPLSGVLCIRCGSLLDPPPPIEPLPEPEPAPPPPAPVVVVVPPKRRWWPWVVLGVAVVVLVVVLIIAL